MQRVRSGSTVRDDAPRILYAGGAYGAQVPQIDTAVDGGVGPRPRPGFDFGVLLAAVVTLPSAELHRRGGYVDTYLELGTVD